MRLDKGYSRCTIRGMKKIAVLLFGLLLVASFSLLLYGRYLSTLPVKVPRGFTYMDKGVESLSESKLLSIIQDWRLSQKLKTYAVDPLLCTFAKKRADEIFTEKNDMSHDGIWKYKSDLFTTYEGFSENLARDWSPELMLDGWLHSASHEANLRRDRPLTCVKCKGYYCVQLFATPK